MPAATQTSFREIRAILGNAVQVAEDGSAFQRLDDESVIDVATGKRATAPRCDILLDGSHLVYRARAYGSMPRFEVSLYSRTGDRFVRTVTIRETLQNLRPFVGSNWPRPGGAEAILVTGASNDLYQATYRWRPASVTYRKIGSIPSKPAAVPVVVSAIDPEGNHAILQTSSGYALWTRGSKFESLGSRPARFWLGRVMAFTQGRIESFGEDELWRTNYTGWTVLGMNSTGEWMVLRREGDRHCFIAHYRRGVVERRHRPSGDR